MSNESQRAAAPMPSLEGLTQSQFKQLLKQLEKEKRKRGPTGSPRLSDTADVTEIIAQIRRLALQHDTHEVEVVDAVLKFLDPKYYISTKARSE